MKNNCKGFVLLETLIVAVFIIGIFTFLYSSVVPLLGTYEDLTNKSSIDVVYKLYHMRKMLYEDENYDVIINSESGYSSITCSDFQNSNSCLKLISNDYLDIDDGYELIYVENISTNKNNVVDSVNSKTLKKYINDYDGEYDNLIFLYDKKNDSAAYLKFTIDK